MFSKINLLIKSLYLRSKGKAIFVYHYSNVYNVGDLLHYNLIKHYCNKKAITPPAIKYFKHYLMVGSILDKMNSNSIVLGAGSNDVVKINQLTEIGDIKALRGVKSKLAIEKKFNISLDIPLGDFALLMPRIYNPNFIKKYKFGLILHYIDESNNIRHLASDMGCNIISVKQSPEAFIDEILKCDKILSSSMHGVILSDAYGIPNVRIKLSDKITGADFKFSDYYSTTDNPDEMGINLKNEVSITDINTALTYCKVSKYLYDLNVLEEIVSSI